MRLLLGRSRHGALLGVAALLLAACGTGAPAPTAALTVAPPTAAPTSSVGEPCSAHLGDECFMFGGDYHSSRFAGGMSFHLIGERWTNVAHEADLISLRIDDSWLIFVHGVITMGAADDPKPVPTAEVAQQLLAARTGLKVTKVADVRRTIDGQKPVVFDVANTGTVPVQLWRYPTTATHDDLDPGKSMRIHWVEHDGKPLFIAIEDTTPRISMAGDDLAETLASVKFD